jgi:uncharacterized membrane protein
LDEPNDHVRAEIEAAITRGIPIIPLLVGKAELPQREELPLSIQLLPDLNGMPIRPGRDYRRDMEDLIKDLRDLIKTPDPEPLPAQLGQQSHSQGSPPSHSQWSPPSHRPSRQWLIGGLPLLALTLGVVIERFAVAGVPRIVVIAITGVAVMQALFSFVEVFLWEDLALRLRFDRESARKTTPVGRNLGIYNGIIAACLIWLLYASRLGAEPTRSLGTLLLVSVIIAGIFGGITFKRQFMLYQSLPALIALGLLWR